MLDRKKLAQLCEMLRSDNDHERAVAARMATDLVRRANTSWSEVILTPQAAHSGEGANSGEGATPKPQTAAPPDAPYPFGRRSSRTPERYGVSAAKLVPALLKKRSLDRWERNRLMQIHMEDLSVGLLDHQWRDLITLAIDFGLWPGSKPNPRRRRKRR